MPFLYGNLGVGGGGGGGSSARNILELRINDDAEMEASSSTIILTTDAEHDLYIEELSDDV